MALATALPYPLQNTVYPPSRAGNRPILVGVGQAARPVCRYCGKRLPTNAHGNYCRASHRVAMSKLKRRLADVACTLAFGWRPGEGEALIARYGLARMETVLGWRGVVWQPEHKRWAFAPGRGT